MPFPYHLLNHNYEGQDTNMKTLTLYFAAILICMFISPAGIPDAILTPFFICTGLFCVFAIIEEIRR